MKGRALTAFLLSLGIIAWSGCTKQLESAYDGQEKSIQSIVQSLERSTPDASTEYLDGSVRVTVTHGEGEALKEDGAVSFYYAGQYISGSSLSPSTLFATNYDVYANSVGWKITDTTAFKIRTVNLAKDDLVEGLRNGLAGVKAGDECYVLFSGKHGFGKKKIANVPSRAALAYHLWIKSVSNN